MTMAIDAAQQQRFGPLPFHDMSYSSHPQLTSPWAPSTSAALPQPQSSSHQALFVASPDANSLPHLNLSSLKHAHAHAHPQPSTSTTTRTSTTTSYASVPATAASAGSPAMADLYARPGLLSAPQDLLGLSGRMPHPAASSAAAYDPTVFTTAGATPVSASFAPSPAPYDQMGYAAAPLRPPTTAAAFSLHPDANSRRYSAQSVASTMSSRILSDHLHPHRSLPSQQQQQQQKQQQQQPPPPPQPQSQSQTQSQHHHPHHHDDRKSFQDALEASHGMLSMSQETPRNIYDVRQGQRIAATAARGGSGADGYGFPTAPPHSASSSLSSSTSFSGYYGASHSGGGSVDGSVSDYSTGGSDIESLSGRLPRPAAHGGGAGGGMLHHHHHHHHPPPAPQSMMGSFNSKMQSSTLKKHKCKVCDKRFTRPSSLQTHMYSHTGEKPFSCEVEGCGRHFSVVSNLRRHRKVHKGQAESQAETPSDAGSEDHQSE